MTRTSAGTRRIAAVSVLVGLTGCCDINFWHACTQMACVDHLNIQFATIPTAPARIELRLYSPADPVAYVYDCKDALSCLSAAGFPGFTPDRVFVTVITTAGKRTTEFRDIAYAKYRPNGHHCNPVCRSATLRVDVPK